MGRMSAHAVMGFRISQPEGGCCCSGLHVRRRCRGPAERSSSGRQHHLADVVQERAEVDGAPLVVAQAQPPRHHVREGGHAAGMAGIEDVHLLEARDQDVGGVGEEVVRPLLVGRVVDRHRRPAGPARSGAPRPRRVNAPSRAAGHDQRAPDRALAQGRGDEAGQQRRHLVAAARVARVPRRGRAPAPAGRSAAARAAMPSPGCRRTPDQRLRAVARARPRSRCRRSGCGANRSARAVALPDSSRAARTRLSSTRSWCGSPAERGAHLLQRLQAAVRFRAAGPRARGWSRVRRARSEASRTARSSRRMSMLGLADVVEDAVLDALDGGLHVRRSRSGSTIWCRGPSP